jgi:hypothetical protein
VRRRRARPSWGERRRASEGERRACADDACAQSRGEEGR